MGGVYLHQPGKWQADNPADLWVGTLDKDAEGQEYKTTLKTDKILEILDGLKARYEDEGYDMLTNNCCHFADELLRDLGVKAGLPGRFTSNAKIAVACLWCLCCVTGNWFCCNFCCDCCCKKCFGLFNNCCGGSTTGRSETPRSAAAKALEARPIV